MSRGLFPAQSVISELTNQSTQHYSCVVIPLLVDIGGPWSVLPPGIHDATMNEVKQRYAFNFERMRLLRGFEAGVNALQRAGCVAVFLNGSFVTEKSTPGDFDACWDPLGVDATKLEPALLDFSNRRERQKGLYGGEFFPSSASADAESTFLEYFQTDKYTGGAKGIIRIQLAAQDDGGQTT